MHAAGLVSRRLRAGPSPAPATDDADLPFPPPQVAGESGLGKTTFINTLFSTTIKNYADHKKRHQKQVDKTVEIEITKAELEEKFFKGTYMAAAAHRLPHPSRATHFG